jgi:predicted dithiol-disulfide oxidoreductase (DUF899 family)
VTENYANLPRVASRDEWAAARKDLLAREKQLTRQRDALNADRRRLPIVRIEKEYVFQGPEGKASLIDLFEGRRQLIVGHFMFDPSWEAGCPSCSAGADEISDGLFRHLTHVTPGSSTSRVRRSRRSRLTRRARAGPSPGTSPTAATSTTTSTQHWTRPLHPWSTPSKP